MSTKQKITQILMSLVLVASLLAPAALSFQPLVAGRVQPALAQAVAGAPDETVRVIVQAAGDRGPAEQMVEALGGRYLKELSFINGFAAEVPARAVTVLGRSSAVQWVSLDAPVISTGKPGPSTATYTLRDNFTTVAFNNNDGVASFTTDWIEEDQGGEGPAAGNVKVKTDTYTKCDETGCYTGFGEGELRLRGDGPSQISVAREMDLSDGVESATLSYTFEIGNHVNANRDSVALEVSTDGGATYTVLNTLAFNSGTTGSAFRDVTDYASSQTRFRFRIVSGYDEEDSSYFAFDNFQIQYEGNALPNNKFLDTLGVREVWDMGYTGSGIGIAIIDSGISGDRDLNVVNRESFNPDSATPNDVFGHGTHVAGIIGMNGTDSGGQYLGIAPDADLISLKISDENGLAYESDTVDALQWVFDNKDQYNIRVVNLSIQSTVEQSYHDSALSVASELLWFNGVVVVAATGNWYGGTVYPLNAGPGNDPFIITVGAADEKGTTRINDDRTTTFSAWGTTQDGFNKPEIFAPGVDIISVLSKNSTWEIEHPERSIFGDQYFRISGTSMATPMVTGAVALLLQAEPNLTPDQVKYRVMHAHNWAGSAPYLSVEKMLTTSTTESANQGIIPTHGAGQDGDDRLLVQRERRRKHRLGESLPSIGTRSIGTPSTGTPSIGTPSTGTPSTGTPSTGTPSTGMPSTGTPSTGTRSTGTPSTGTRSIGMR